MGHKRTKPPIGGNKVICVISLKVCLEAISLHFLNPHLQVYIQTVNALLWRAICNLVKLYRSIQHEALALYACPRGSSQLHV